MYAICSTLGNRRWLSGVFLELATAEASRAALPAPSATRHVLEFIPVADFPLFILEDHAGFRFFDAVGAAQALAVMAPPSVDGEPILFTLRAEFRPDADGRDEMGQLRHIHLDSARLAELRLSGLSSLTE